MARIVGQKPPPTAGHFDAKSQIAEIVNYSIVGCSLDVNNVSNHPFVAVIQTYRINPVATLSTHSAGGIIESAASFFGSSAPKPSRATSPSGYSATPESNKQERAMARRLEQLHTALGDSAAAPTTAATAQNVSPSPESAKSVGTVALIITAIVSALSGAGTMWLCAPQAPTHLPPVLQTMAGAPVVVPTLREPAFVAPSTSEPSDKTKISQLLDAWRNAWAQRDIASYLNAYSQQFTPADGNTRNTWVATRTKKLSAGAPIDIQIRELGIERINGDQFKATFLQDYASGSYREMARTKVLLIARENGEWKITKEWLEENKLAMK